MSEVTCCPSILPSSQCIITMATMKASTKKNDTSEALPLLEHPNHKSKPTAVSDTIQKDQRREEEHLIIFQACPFKNVRTTLWSNVKYVDWADLAKK